MSVSDFLLFSSASSHTPSPVLPADFVVLITDQLESPATFLLTHFMSRALRPAPSAARSTSASAAASAPQGARRVVFVGSANPFEHYQSILRRNGVQLTAERDRGQFHWIDGGPSLGFDLQALYEQIATVVRSPSPSPLPPGQSGPLIVLEDVSAMFWSGVALKDLVRFVSSLRQLGQEAHVTVVLLMHADELARRDSDERVLFTRLFGLSDIWLEVTNLETQARGELSVHLGPCLKQWDVTPRSGPNALQYKMEESGAMMHVKGLGRGFL